MGLKKYPIYSPKEKSWPLRGQGGPDLPQNVTDGDPTKGVWKMSF